MAELIEQKEDKKYYLTELGVYAYNSLKDNIETIKTPLISFREVKSPILRKLMLITSKSLIQLEEVNKIYSIVLSIGILILGTILSILNGFYAFLLFFMEFDQISLDSSFRILISFSFILNLLMFFIVIEGISRLLYKKKENTLNFLISFAIIQFPMIFYLVVHLIFKFTDLLAISAFNFIDKVLMIIFQVWSLWLLSYSLSVKKGLRIESSLIISLLLHYGGFTLILFILI